MTIFQEIVLSIAIAMCTFAISKVDLVWARGAVVAHLRVSVRPTRSGRRSDWLKFKNPTRRP
ncbi:MAG TPA: hypothetical protein VH684_07325 [Xanthobacteraceae bacterium]|jgi:hypothetical protein